jgi:hypothetical protein
VHPVVELLEERFVLLLAGFGGEAEGVDAFDADFFDVGVGLQDLHDSAMKSSSGMALSRKWKVEGKDADPVRSHLGPAVQELTRRMLRNCTGDSRVRQ